MDTTETQSIPSQMCLKHSQKKIEFVQVNDVSNSQNSQLLYCTKCINAFQGLNNYLLISQIIEEGESQIIQKWPPVNDYSVIEQLISFTEQIDSSPAMALQIKSFFAQLKDEVLKKIDFCEKNTLDQANKISSEKQLILNQYKQISQISKLRSILLEGDKMENQLYQQSCRQFISQMESQRQKNSELLSNLLNLYKGKEYSINMEQPNELKNYILTLIDQINFFNSSSKTNENSQLNMSTKTQDRPNSTTSGNNKTVDLSKLSEKKFELMREFIDHSARLEFNQEYSQKIENSFEYQFLEQIIDSSVNFMSDSLKVQMRKFLIDTYPFLKQVNFSNAILEKDKFDCLRQLSSHQIEDLCAYLQRQQGQTAEYVYNYPPLEKTKTQDLQGFPLDSFQLTKTNFNDGKKRIKIVQNRQLSIDPSYKSSHAGSWINCVSNIPLQKEKKYLFRFSIEKGRQDNCITFGLMQSSKSDTFDGIEERMSCQFQYQENQFVHYESFGIDQYQEGDKFVLTKGSEVEMRVYLGGQILEILDYPNYQYKLKILDIYQNKFNQCRDLKLYIGMHSEEIKVNLTSAFEVVEFPK